MTEILNESPAVKRLRRMNEAIDRQKKKKEEESTKKIRGEGGKKFIDVSSTRIRFNKFKEEAISKLTGNLFKEELFSIFLESLPLDDEFKSQKRNALVTVFNRVLEDTLYEIDKGNYDISSPEVVAMLTHKNNNAIVTDLYQNCKIAACDQVDLDMYNATGTVPDKMMNDIKGMNYVLNEKPNITESKKDLDDGIKSDFDTINRDSEKEISEIVSDKVIKAVAKEKEIAKAKDEENKKMQNEISLEVPDDNDDEKKTEDPNHIEESVKRVHTIRSGMTGWRPEKLLEHSLFRTINIAVFNKYITENKALSEDAEVVVNTDMVFAESLCYQTLLEQFNTMGLLKVDEETKLKYVKRVISKI